MWIMARLALDPLLPVHRSTPFVGSGLVAGPTQVGIGRNGHGGVWMRGLERSMAGFTRDPSFGVLAGLRIESGCMAFKA